nr:UxaA family hydrolase [Dorea sp. AM58-8]
MSITFQGYMRPDGRAGSRNYVAVIPSVICATDVAQAICRQVQAQSDFFIIRDAVSYQLI